MLVSAQGWNKALRTLNEFGVLDSVFGVPKELGDVSSELKIGSDISAKLAELLATDLTKFLFLFLSCLLNIINNDIAFFFLISFFCLFDKRNANQYIREIPFPLPELLGDFLKCLVLAALLYPLREKEFRIKKKLVPATTYIIVTNNLKV